MKADSPRLTTLLRELPGIVGVAVGWYLLWWLGRAFVRLPFPIGFDWPEYFGAARLAVLGRAEGYPPFRRPLYPWLLGTLGERLDYLDAGVLLSSAGTGAVVLGAAVAGRALGGPWAGGLAAATVPLVAHLASFSHHVTLYAPQAGVAAGALALGAVTMRWPSAWAALGAGVAGGVSWAMDPRGALALPTVAVLVLLGALAKPKGGRARAPTVVLVGVFALGVLAGPLTDRTLRVALPLPARQMLELQRENILRQAVGTGGRAFLACSTEPPREVPNLAALRRPCARAFVAWNRSTHADSVPFGLAWTLIALPFALLPGRHGWRGTVASAAVFVPAAVKLGVMSLWMMLPERYVLAEAVPLALIVPVGVSRAFATLGHVARAPRALVTALTATALLGAGARVAGRLGEEKRAVPALAVEALDTDPHSLVAGPLRARVAAGDHVLDCADANVELALQPLTAPRSDAERARACAEWARRPPAAEGEAWLLTSGLGIAGATLSPGWERVDTLASARVTYVYWRWRGEAASPIHSPPDAPRPPPP